MHTPRVIFVEPDRVLGPLYVGAVVDTLGYDAYLATSVAQAVAILQEQQTVELVILEPMLQGHDGVELLYELQSYADWRAIPVLLYTAEPHFLLWTDKPETIGVTQILYKPTCRISELIDRISAATLCLPSTS
jgi:DNA-binding response OmpR family regulator